MPLHRIPPALAALAILMACASSTPPSPPELGPAKEFWLFGPTPAQDLINAETTEDSLRTKFGAEHVRHDSIYVGEGMYQSGTILFPDDSTRRVEIFWEDTVRQAHASFIKIHNRASRWRVYPGVGIGTTLAEVDSLNHGPFELAGFGWDHAGTTYSFLGGPLDSLWRPTGAGHDILLRFLPTMPGYDSLSPTLDGEGSHRSDEPTMMLAKPRVYEIVVRLTRHR